MRRRVFSSKRRVGGEAMQVSRGIIVYYVAYYKERDGSRQEISVREDAVDRQ